VPLQDALNSHPRSLQKLGHPVPSCLHLQTIHTQQARTTSNLATYHLWRPKRCIRRQTTRKSSDTTTVLLACQPSWRRFFVQHWPSQTLCGGNLSAETVIEIRLLPLDLSGYGFVSLESRNTCVVAFQVLKCLNYHPNRQYKNTVQLPLYFLKVVSDSNV